MVNSRVLLTRLIDKCIGIVIGCRRTLTSALLTLRLVLVRMALIVIGRLSWSYRAAVKELFVPGRGSIPIGMRLWVPVVPFLSMTVWPRRL